MSQSLACLHIHLIFSTKNREKLLSLDVRPSLHAYMATVLQNIGCPALLINSVEDHVHVLFDLARTVALSHAVEVHLVGIIAETSHVARTVALSHAVEDLKKSSSKWIKTQSPAFSSFAWQAGYGALAVSESNKADVLAYISHQAEHHREKSFQDEYRTTSPAPQHTV